MSEYIFGTGRVFSCPVGGGAPVRWAALQDVSVDFSADVKMLHGQYQFPLDTARGKTKIEWKAGSGNVDVEMYNSIYFGQTVASNNELVQIFNEAASVPGSVAYTITAANGATFYMDLGVFYAATGLPFKQVASGPTIGQYTVNPATGVYTFAAADASAAVLLNYLYTSASTGAVLEIANRLMGDTPKFQLVLTHTYSSKSLTLILYSNTADKLSMPLKQDDYLVNELSGSAHADSAGRVGRITTTSHSAM